VQEQIERLSKEARAAAAAAGDVAGLDAVRVHWLGRKGELTLMLRQLKDVAADERPAAGQALNRAKQEISAAVELRQAELLSVSDATALDLDLTRPGRGSLRGSLHPVPEVIDEICEIFQGLGFSRVEGHEVLLRTQTSPVQVRTMRDTEPPLAIVAPGRVYRQEQPDASHAAEFHQIEGLLVDHDVSLADLKATVHHFVRAFYGGEVKLRFRPHFFPFTEPSVEVDLWWESERGGRWLEIMGAGMVHPNVFTNTGIDPERWTGFAFGMGVDRMVLVRHGIDDIRLLLDNDLRFLNQF